MRRFVHAASVSLLASLAALFMHEGAHAITAVAFGGAVKQIAVIPGIQLFPQCRIIPWDSSLGSVSMTVPGTKRALGCIDLAGSLSTAFTGFLLLLLSWMISNNHRVSLRLLIAGIIFCSDLLLYSVLPLAGLKHYLFVGGSSPEPLDGFLQLGGTHLVYGVLLAGFTIVVAALVVQTVRNLGLAEKVQV